MNRFPTRWPQIILFGWRVASVPTTSSAMKISNGLPRSDPS